MHTVDLLEEALGAAERLGFRLRHEWLGGAGGGGCEYNGRKWMFLDLALAPADQLQQVAETLRHDPGLARLELTTELRQLLNVRKIA